MHGASSKRENHSHEGELMEDRKQRIMKALEKFEKKCKCGGRCKKHPGCRCHETRQGDLTPPPVGSSGTTERLTELAGSRAKSPSK